MRDLIGQMKTFVSPINKDWIIKRDTILAQELLNFNQLRTCN